MNFGSSFVYNYDRSPSVSPPSNDNLSEEEEEEEEEEEDDAGLHTHFGPMNGPGTTIHMESVPEHVPVGPAPTEVKIVRKKKAAKKLRQLDTNIIKVSFEYLLEAAPLSSTSIPPKCSECPAYLFDMQTTLDPATNQHIWTCKYCLTKNVVETSIDIDTYTSGMEFILKDDHVLRKSTARDANLSTEGCTIFCVDTSGSMSEDMDRYIKGIINGCSKMNATKAAVRSKIIDLNDDHFVGIVDFCSEISVADGSTPSYNVVLRNDNILDSLDKLQQSVKHLKPLTTLANSRNNYLALVEDFRSTSSTALGPGLWIALQMAVKVECVGLKRIVICTDGCSNSGVGSLNNREAAAAFYEKCAALANENGIIIDTVGFQNCYCQLAELSRLASGTGGSTGLCADATAVCREIAGDEQLELMRGNMARNCQLTLILFKDLYVRNCSDVTSDAVRAGTDSKTPKCDLHYYKRSFPIALADKSLSMEYGVRRELNAHLYDTEELKAMTNATNAASSGPLDVDSMEQVPFQLLIEYDDAFRRVLRVFELSKPLTRDMTVANASKNLQTVSEHISSNIGSNMLAGDYKVSKEYVRRAQPYSSIAGNEDLNLFVLQSSDVIVKSKNARQTRWTGKKNDTASQMAMRSAYGDADADWMVSASSGHYTTAVYKQRTQSNMGAQQQMADDDSDSSESDPGITNPGLRWPP